jgi:hypothetical protein
MVLIVVYVYIRAAVSRGLMVFISFDRTIELPPLDMFVTTADPVLEPPILTINTILSLLAVDYPGNKLACYVSDDAASPVTFYCLVEASKFAKLWVPFCKKYSVRIRAPFQYFTGEILRNSSLEFQEEWKKIKVVYFYEYIKQIKKSKIWHNLPHALQCQTKKCTFLLQIISTSFCLHFGSKLMQSYAKRLKAPLRNAFHVILLVILQCLQTLKGETIQLSLR